MKETIRTLSFVGVALVSAGVAWFVNAGAKPAEAEAYAKVGTEFYPEFTDPTKAGSIEITSYDKTTKEPQSFKVEFQRGRWRIPSHHGYPADAKDRLEEAAASLIGITRQALAGRRANSHERFGVVAPPETNAPADEDAEPLEGVGQRITLKDKSGNVLADYILGKRLADQANVYFVRTPNEDETYHAEIEADVSTKFGDWVEKDLLKLNRDNLLSMELKTPKFEMVETPFGPAEAFVGEDTLNIHRDETGPGSKWQIDDLNAATEEINTSEIGGIQTGLDSLELTGVRPKPQGLTPDLRLDLEQFPKNQNAQQHFRGLQTDLSSRGFQLARPGKNATGQQFGLFGEGGEMVAQSNEGLVYHLHFGKAFQGSEKDIEVGKTEIADEEGNDVDQPAEPKAVDKSKAKLNRYLFIRVEFDESLLGKAPVKPPEPEKPADLKDTESKPNPQPADDSKVKTPEELRQEQLRRDYESQLALHRNQLVAYEEDDKEYQKKRKAGEAKVKELNDRFREWYYVIPETSYETLTFTRADVVQEKKQEEPKPPATPGLESPGSSALDAFLKGMSGAVKRPGETQPAIADKPPAQAAKPE
jgi:Domain of unknown function (DUF4340)